MTDRTFTQAQVDALVATERALVVQKAAELCNDASALAAVNEQHGRDVGNKMIEYSRSVVQQYMHDLKQQLLALADQNLLQAHDAALRAERDQKWIDAEGSNVLVEEMRSEKAKLEAENAGLRKHLNWALAHVTTEMCGDECNDYDDHHAKAKKARALLAKSGAEAPGPKGRK